VIRGFLAQQQATGAEAAAATPVAEERASGVATVVRGSAAASSSRLAVRLRSATGSRSLATMSRAALALRRRRAAGPTARPARVCSAFERHAGTTPRPELTISDAIAGAMTGSVQTGGAGTVALDNITATIIDIIGTSTQLPWAAIDSSLGSSFHSVAQGRLYSVRSAASDILSNDGDGQKADTADRLRCQGKDDLRKHSGRRS
jgi:hypothetical protein